MANKPGQQGQRGQGLTRAPDPELLERFLQLQENELAVRQEELSIRKQETANSHEFSKKGLDAQLEDRQRERQANQKSRRDRLVFAGFVVLVLVAFIVFALYMNKDAIALEIIKGAIFLISGYFAGRFHQKKTDEPDK